MSAESFDLPGTPGRSSADGGKQNQARIQLAEVCFKFLLPWFGWIENICLSRSWLIAVYYWPGSEPQMVSLG